MNKHQKEAEKAKLQDERKVLNALKEQYKQAAEDVQGKLHIHNNKIDFILNEYDELDDDMKSILQAQIYQQNFQKQIKAQLDTIVEKLNDNQYDTIQEYLDDCYVTGFVGTAFDLHGQGVPLVLPIDQKAMVDAVTLSPKLSAKLYGSYMDQMKANIAAEISRGIAVADSFEHIARNISNRTNQSFNKTMRIVRTEGHGVQIRAAVNMQERAKKAGADVLKQWDATLDARTRDSHARLDGEIRELDEKFSNGMKHPSDPSGGAAEVINCRCALLQRAKWGLDEEELEVLKERAEHFGLDKTDNFNDFKKKYLNAEKIASTITLSEILYEDAVRTAVRDVEKENKGLDHEVATIVDKQGNIVLAVDGERGNVEVPLDVLKNNIMTHNHPDGGSFSKDDVRAFVVGDVLEIRATTPDGMVYSLRKNKSVANPQIADDFAEATSISKIYEIMEIDYNNGILSWEEAADYNTVVKYKSDYGEKWLKENAEKYGCTFVVEKE